ncbi:hypothetical protein PINS_up011332 [Pythium insidiosum]|nr:hypothetical protein PINS_up011332 [Pythium insidiosum]
MHAETARVADNDCRRLKAQVAHETHLQALRREQAQMAVEDWRSARLAQEARDQNSDQERCNALTLLAQLKQTELRELQWQDAYTQQVDTSVHLEERLLMLLEDCRSSAVVCEDRNKVDHHHHLRRASSITSVGSDLSQYQQKIELLEAQLVDARQQIRCDHEQFLYEQTKWSVEKKHLSKDVEEIHDVSAKVLKVLLLREKLLKRKERQVQTRLVETAGVAHAAVAVLDDVTQEIAVALVHLRQVAVTSAAPASALTTSDSDIAATAPRRVARQIKRLQRLRDQLVALSANEQSSGSHVNAVGASTSVVDGVGNSSDPLMQRQRQRAGAGAQRFATQEQQPKKRELSSRAPAV